MNRTSPLAGRGKLLPGVPESIGNSTNEASQTRGRQSSFDQRNEKITYSKFLGGIASKHAGVQLLMTIPGVGIRTAEAVMAYIDDPRRFKRIKAVGSYFGLVPTQDASANDARSPSLPPPTTC